MAIGNSGPAPPTPTRRADQTSAALREARQWADYYERMWNTADAELERLRLENQRLLEERNEH